MLSFSSLLALSYLDILDNDIWNRIHNLVFNLFHLIRIDGNITDEEAGITIILYPLLDIYYQVDFMLLQNLCEMGKFKQRYVIAT